VGYLNLIQPIATEIGSLTQQRQADIINDSFESANGVVLEGISLSGTAVDVWHHLGRRWTQYEILKRDGGGDVFDVGGEVDPSKSIRLQATSAVVVTLRIR